MKRTPSLVIKDAIKQQKLMVYILKLAALDNQCLRVPRNSDIQESYIRWPDSFTCCYSHIRQFKAGIWCLSSDFTGTGTRGNGCKFLINSLEVSMKLLPVTFMGNSVIDNKENIEGMEKVA